MFKKGDRVRLRESPSVRSIGIQWMPPIGWNARIRTKGSGHLYLDNWWMGSSQKNGWGFEWDFADYRFEKIEE